MVGDLTRDAFAGDVDDAFEVRCGDASAIALELIEANEPWVSGDNEMFSLVFRGPSNAFLPQATYRFRHDAFGAFDLFIVPIGGDEAGYRYEAVFNRTREEREP